MSISSSLSNALSGLTAASRMAEVVSSNLSNVLTDGYGRRVVDLSAQNLGGNGAGVKVDGISRMIDRGVLAERRLADAQYSRTLAISEASSRLETIVGAPDDPASLGGRIAALEASLASAAVEPSDLRLQDVTSKLNAVSKTLNDDQAGIREMRQEADADIADQVAQLNSALKRVEVLNGDILKARVQGVDPSALMDQRQVAIDKITGIVPVREVNRADGRVALMTESGEALLDGPAPTYKFEAAGIIMPHMTFEAELLSGITKNGQPMSAGNGFGRLSGGALEAAFILRDQTLVGAQTNLDAVARDLVERFADPATDPTISAGQPGLFTDGGMAFNSLNSVGLAGRISLNSSVDPATGGALWRLRDGIGATAPGPIGNARQIDSWASALSERRSLASGGIAASVSGLVANFSSSISMARVAADEEQSFASARWSALREAELAGGVDTDQELQMLLRVEQAYAANAKVVESIDQMINTLMQI